MKQALEGQNIVGKAIAALTFITVIVTLGGRLVPDYWQTNFLMFSDVGIGFGSCITIAYMVRGGKVSGGGFFYIASLPALCLAYFFFNFSALPRWRWTAGSVCFFMFGLFTIVFMKTRYRQEIRRFSKSRQALFLSVFAVALGLALEFIVVPLSFATTPIVGPAFALYVGYRILFAAIFALAVTLSASIMSWPDLVFLLALTLFHASGFGWVHRLSGEKITILNWSWQIWNASLFLLFGIMLLNCDAHHGFLLRQPTFSRGGSVRVVLTAAVFSGTLLMIIGLLHTNVFVVGDGVRLSSLLSAGACTWAFAACLGLAVAGRLRAVRAQMLSGSHDGRSVGEGAISLGPILLDELRGWLSAYNRVVAKSDMLAHRVAEQESNVALSEIAAQVSHDIRSPLAALSMLAHDVSWKCDDEQILFRQAVKRIEGIAEDLVDKKRIKTSGPEIVMVSALVRQIVSEKKVLLRERENSVRLEIRPSPDAYGLFIEGNVPNLKRVFSNLLNNALEAVPQSTGDILISMERMEDKVIVRLRDNGPGISDEILRRLGERGATLNKPGGRGLGIHHALKTVKNHNGSLTFQRCTSSSGTLVELTLPEASPPAWFVAQLRLSRASNVFVLDDDPTVHAVWRRRLEKVATMVIGASSEAEFDDAMNANAISGGNDIFLIDYDLKNSERNGLHIIAKIRQCAQKILVTSHYEDSHLRLECQKRCIKILPKVMVGSIPIIDDRGLRA